MNLPFFLLDFDIQNRRLENRSLSQALHQTGKVLHNTLALKEVNFIVSTSQLQKLCLYKFLKEPIKERQKRTERHCWKTSKLGEIRYFSLFFSVSDYA